MMIKKIKNKIKKLPDGPGVYLFKRGNKILYIGKATSLRDRVRSYMSRLNLDTRGPVIKKMIEETNDVQYIKTDSVLEALILEANLIKKYQPKANTLEKDDKSFNYVVITEEEFPRVLIMRGRELRNNPPPTPSHVFGPFPNGGQLKEAIKIIRKLFPFSDKCAPNQKRPCFNRQIGLCPGVCTGEISTGEYAEQVKNIILFFEGKKKQLVRNLEKQMKNFAKSHEFEKAAQIKNKIFALSHIQDISLIKEEKIKSDGRFRIESYDVAHLSGTNMVGVMTVVEDGEAKKSDYRKFRIRETKGGDIAALSEILSRRLGHGEWPAPELIVVDGGKAQKNAMEKVLWQNKLKIPVVAVVKDEYHRPREIMGIRSWQKKESEILIANAESHRFAIGFHKHLRRRLK